MSDSSIQKALVQFFRDRFDVELPSTSIDLIEAGILDSLMLVEVVFYIEEQFSVTTELDDLEMENFVTVDDMARFVAARQPSSGPMDPDGEQTAATAPGGPSAGKEGE